LLKSQQCDRPPSAPPRKIDIDINRHADVFSGRKPMMPKYAQGA